jgi:hypothetical protein
MQAAERTRRDWSIGLAASILMHLLMLGFVRFAPVPSTGAADETTTVAILRITKRVNYAHGRRGGAAAAPRISRTKPERSTAAAHVARGAAAPGSKRASTTAEVHPAGASAAHARTQPAAGEPATGAAASAAGAEATGAPASPAAAEESPGPAPTITAEMLASLNQRMRNAIPSAAPLTMKRYTTDMGTLAVHPDPNRWTVANYPLPQRGLFAHAIIVRVGREAVAVRAIQRIGNAYICIGYLAKIDEHNPDATLAGPYIGPCKKAWREQLGLVPKPAPSPSAASSTGAPVSPAPSASSSPS